MKSKIAILITLTIVTFACDKKKNQTEVVDNNSIETPKALEDNDAMYSLSKFSSRYDSNIIEKLYEEALDKNENLKILHNKVDLISSDSLNLKTKPYRKYSKINNTYWQNVYSYSKSINDSTTRKLIIDVFEKLEKKL